jgi:hypothetical protein
VKARISFASNLNDEQILLFVSNLMLGDDTGTSVLRVMSTTYDQPDIQGLNAYKRIYHIADFTYSYISSFL